MQWQFQLEQLLDCIFSISNQDNEFLSYQVYYFMSVYLFVVCLSLCQSTCFSVCLSVCLSPVIVRSITTIQNEGDPSLMHTHKQLPGRALTQINNKPGKHPVRCLRQCRLKRGNSKEPRNGLKALRRLGEACQRSNLDSKCFIGANIWR